MTVPCGGGGGSGTVTSISQGTGITNTPNPITTTGTIAVNQAFSPTWTGSHTFSQPATFNNSITTASGTPLTLNPAGAGNGIYMQANGTTLMDFGITVPNYIVISANTSLAALGGLGEMSLSGMRGDSDLPSGNLVWNGRTGKNLSLNATGGGGITITSDATSSWTTGTGDLTVKALAGESIFGQANSTTKTLGLISQSLGPELTIASNAITPSANVHAVGAGVLKTINFTPASGLSAVLQILPTAAFTYDATGNISVPSGGGTAVVDRVITFVWSGAKWVPSY